MLGQIQLTTGEQIGYRPIGNFLAMLDQPPLRGCENVNGHGDIPGRQGPPRQLGASASRHQTPIEVDETVLFPLKGDQTAERLCGVDSVSAMNAIGQGRAVQG